MAPIGRNRTRNYYPWGSFSSTPRPSCFFSRLPCKVDASKAQSCAKLSTLARLWRLLKLLGRTYGGLRLVWVSDVWLDFDAGAPLFRRPQQRDFFQHAAPSRFAARETAIYMSRGELCRRTQLNREALRVP